VTTQNQFSRPLKVFFGKKVGVGKSIDLLGGKHGGHCLTTPASVLVEVGAKSIRACTEDCLSKCKVKQ